MRLSVPSHPALVAFDQTYERDFPVIMVFGREPSTDESTVCGIGKYDFRGSPNRAFWNTSYGVTGATIGMETAALKALCIARRASPLVYADALPITIKNAILDKATLRAAVSDAAITAHVAHGFSHEPIIRRVGLVLLSGLTALKFQRPATCYRTACESRGISVAETPFFYGTNVPKIRATLIPETMDQIRAIMNRFRFSENEPVG